MRVEVGDLEGAQASLDELVERPTRYGFDQWAILAATQREVVNGHRLPGAATSTDEDRVRAGRRTPPRSGMHLGMWKLIDQWVAITFYITVQGGVLARRPATATPPAPASRRRWPSRDRTGMRFYDPEALRHLANLEDDPDGSASRACGRVDRREPARTAPACSRCAPPSTCTPSPATSRPLADALTRIPAAVDLPRARGRPGPRGRRLTHADDVALGGADLADEADEQVELVLGQPDRAEQVGVQLLDGAVEQAPALGGDLDERGPGVGGMGQRGGTGPPPRGGRSRWSRCPA